MSSYEAGKHQPALLTLSKLIEATGHTLSLSLKRSDPAVRGLPDSPLGRKLRQHRQALLDTVAEAGGSNLLVDLPEGTGLFALLALEGRFSRILRGCRPGPAREAQTSGSVRSRGRGDPAVSRRDLETAVPTPRNPGAP
jgi:hypothetical protein